AWGVVHRADNALMGQCGLNRLPDGAVEVFYALAKGYWGQGLATEAAHAAVEYGFEVVKLLQIIALAYPDNTASRHVIEKLGMRYQGTTDRYYNIEFAYYTLDAAEHAARQNSA
ncbi:MAG: GNAT family N-acetyltransferase, partial [Anaerolineae bacterium]|nr:GNAT family N-acetyltransferase [Anaerolineae bacterium]